MSSASPSVTPGAERLPGPYYVRVGDTSYLTWDGGITDGPHRAETAAYADRQEAEISAITACLQTRQPVSVVVRDPASGPFGVLTRFLTVSWVRGKW